MNNHGTDFLDQPTKRRPVNGSTDGSLDIQSAVDFMDSASQQVFHMSKDLAMFAAHAKAMLDGGLTMEAIVALMQDSLPKQKNGRPQAARMIVEVLEAAANLGTKYLKPTPKR